jgi:hypothetical protein
MGLCPQSLLLYIILVKWLHHRALMTLTSHRTKDLRISLDPSSLHFSKKLQQLALSFLISLQSCTENLQYTSDHTDPITITKPLSIHHIDVLPSPSYIS